MFNILLGFWLFKRPDKRINFQFEIFETWDFGGKSASFDKIKISFVPEICRPFSVVLLEDLWFLLGIFSRMWNLELQDLSAFMGWAKGFYPLECLLNRFEFLKLVKVFYHFILLLKSSLLLNSIGFL